MRKFLLGLIIAAPRGSSLPPVRVVPQNSDEGEGLEAILHKIRAFLLLHVKIDVSDIFLSPISCNKLIAEFRRLCKEGADGILLDLYSSTILLLTFYMLKDRFYQLDRDFVRKFEKTVCYILDREKEIVCRYVSSEAFHRSIADLSKQAETQSSRSAPPSELAEKTEAIQKVELPVSKVVTIDPPKASDPLKTVESAPKAIDPPKASELQKTMDVIKTVDPPVQSTDGAALKIDPLDELNKLIEISEKAPYPIEVSSEWKPSLLVNI